MEKILSALEESSLDCIIGNPHTIFTDRQLTCRRLALKHLQEKNFERALHEFMDCIDNFGETYKRERIISVEECVLYHDLASLFSLYLKK